MAAPMSIVPMSLLDTIITIEKNCPDDVAAQCIEALLLEHAGTVTLDEMREILAYTFVSTRVVERIALNNPAWQEISCAIAINDLVFSLNKSRYYRAANQIEGVIWDGDRAVARRASNDSTPATPGYMPACGVPGTVPNTPAGACGVAPKYTTDEFRALIETEPKLRLIEICIRGEYDFMDYMRDLVECAITSVDDKNSLRDVMYMIIAHGPVGTWLMNTFGIAIDTRINEVRIGGVLVDKK